MSIRLGLARQRNVKAIAAMSRGLIEHGLPSMWNERRISKCISNPDCVVLVARDRRRVAGFAVAEFWDDRIHINLFCVAPSYQRQGVGRSLLQWLESSAKTAGTFLMHLEVRESNTGARDFYKKQGFVETGFRRGYYAGQEDAVRLARDLRVTSASSSSF